MQCLTATIVTQLSIHLGLQFAMDCKLQCLTTITHCNVWYSQLQWIAFCNGWQCLTTNLDFRVVPCLQIECAREFFEIVYKLSKNCLKIVYKLNVRENCSMLLPVNCLERNLSLDAWQCNATTNK